MNNTATPAPAPTVADLIDLIDNPYPAPAQVWLGKVPAKRDNYAAESDAFLAVGMAETARCFAVKRRYNCLRLAEYQM